MSDTPRAYTKEEVCKDFISSVKEIARYWSKVDDEYHKTTLDKIEGAMHSLLVMIDGMSSRGPAIDLVLRPHPEDKDYHIENEENYYENGMVINDDVMLHDLLYAKEI